MDGQSVVWITLESIRYDYTSLSNYELETTPSLQPIAASQGGNAFSHCISHGNWTGTSSASILTGTTPPTHGIFGESNLVLPRDVATVPELLPRRIYLTQYHLESERRPGERARSRVRSREIHQPVDAA